MLRSARAMLLIRCWGLMNNYVFADADSPLKNLKVKIQGNRLRLTGNFRKGINLPFELDGSLEPTPDGLIRFRTTSVKSAHIPVEGLMKLLGLKVAKLIN